MLHEQTCHLCRQPILRNEAWELEHIVPWELTRDDSDDNVWPAHARCHKTKTKTDTAGIRKADRIRQKSYGIKKGSGRSLRHPTLRRTLSGKVVER